MDAVAESRRKKDPLVSLTFSLGAENNKWADAGWDSRTYLARPYIFSFANCNRETFFFLTTSSRIGDHTR